MPLGARGGTACGSALPKISACSPELTVPWPPLPAPTFIMGGMCVLPHFSLDPALSLRNPLGPSSIQRLRGQRFVVQIHKHATLHCPTPLGPYPRVPCLSCHGFLSQTILGESRASPCPPTTWSTSALSSSKSDAQTHHRAQQDKNSKEPNSSSFRGNWDQ